MSWIKNSITDKNLYPEIKAYAEKWIENTEKELSEKLKRPIKFELFTRIDSINGGMNRPILAWGLTLNSLYPDQKDWEFLLPSVDYDMSLCTISFPIIYHNNLDYYGMKITDPLNNEDGVFKDRYNDFIKIFPTIAFKQMIVNRMAANAGIKDYWSKRLADAQFFDNWLNSVAVTTSNTPITKNIISKTQTRFNSDKNAARAFLRAERKKITKTLNNELCKAWDKENRTMNKDVTT